MFSLYYHAFVFMVFSALFVVSHTSGVLPGMVRAAIGFALLGWLVAYLPIALRPGTGWRRGRSRWSSSWGLA